MDIISYLITIIITIIMIIIIRKIFEKNNRRNKKNFNIIKDKMNIYKENLDSENINIIIQLMKLRKQLISIKG